MTSFSHVSVGQRIEIPTAEFHNAVVDAVNSYLRAARGISSQTEQVTEDRFRARRYIFCRSHDNIAPYSIFSISYGDSGTGTGTAGFEEAMTTGTGTGGTISASMGFDPRYPKVYTKKVEDTTDLVFVANQAQGLGADHNYTLNIIGDEEPVQVTYDSSDGIPIVGDTVGPKPDTYYVSKEYTGFVAVSAPDLDNDRIWIIKTASKFELTELCLAENHPGYGEVFTAYKGTWSPAANGWTYDCAELVYAIDWRYGTPYPNAGSRGLFTPRISTTYGEIWECVSLDCESPGDCCATGTATATGTASGS